MLELPVLFVGAVAKTYRRSVLGEISIPVSCGAMPQQTRATPPPHRDQTMPQLNIELEPFSQPSALYTHHIIMQTNCRIILVIIGSVDPILVCLLPQQEISQ